MSSKWTYRYDIFEYISFWDRNSEWTNDHYACNSRGVHHVHSVWCRCAADPPVSDCELMLHPSEPISNWV